MLRPLRPIVEVRLLHPVLSPEHHEGRALIVDLVAIDDQGVRVQVEMQTSSHGHLRPRMLLGWAKLYGGQLSAGEGFAALRPVISLWFCDRDALPAPPPGRPEPFHGRFEVREPIGGTAIFSHLGCPSPPARCSRRARPTHRGWTGPRPGRPARSDQNGAKWMR